MYNLPHFKEPDQQIILEFIQAHPFAMLIGCNNQVPVATQVPLLIEKRGTTFFKRPYHAQHRSSQGIGSKIQRAIVYLPGPIRM